MILKGHTFAKVLIWIGTAVFSAGALLSFDFEALCVSFFFAASALCAWACDSPVQEDSFRPSEILTPDALRAARDFMFTSGNIQHFQRMSLRFSMLLG